MARHVVISALMLFHALILVCATEQENIVINDVPEEDTEETIGVEGLFVVFELASASDRITWHREDDTIIEQDNVKYIISDDGSRLNITGLTTEDGGLYRAISDGTLIWTTNLVIKANCRNIDPVSHSIVNTPDGTYEGKYAVFTCDGGYGMTGEANVLCQADGTWAPERPECINLEIILNEKYEQLYRMIIESTSDLDSRINSTILLIEALQVQYTNMTGFMETWEERFRNIETDDGSPTASDVNTEFQAFKSAQENKNREYDEMWLQHEQDHEASQDDMQAVRDNFTRVDQSLRQYDVYNLYISDDNVGQITSYEFPIQYLNEQNQTELIEVDAPKVEITFHEVDIENSEDCVNDYLAIYDGDSIHAPLLGKFCGNQLPDSILSSGNTVFIEFFTNEEVTLTGFRLTYRLAYTEEIDYCKSASCTHGSSCVNIDDAEGGYTCSCPAGYDAQLCDHNIDECIDNECVNGICVDGIAVYSCNCNAGYEGIFCAQDIDECLSSPCYYGSCNNLENAFSCTCDSGYEGDLCNINIDDCVSAPCYGGQCHDEVNSFWCECWAGYAGTFCDEVFGWVVFPDNGLQYDNNVEYEWYIPSAPGSVIVLYFMSMDIEYHYSCYYDSLRVYSGSNVYGRLLATLCGATTPDNIQSDSNEILLYFTSDYSVTGGGFHI